MTKPDLSTQHDALGELDHVGYDAAAGHEPEGYTPAMTRLRAILDQVAPHVSTEAREAWCMLAPEARRASIVALLGAVFGGA